MKECYGTSLIQNRNKSDGFVSVSRSHKSPLIIHLFNILLFTSILILWSLSRPKQRRYIFLTIWCISLKISSTFVIRCHIGISWRNWIDIWNIGGMWLIYHISHLSDCALYMIILSFDWWTIADYSVRHPNLHLFAISLNLTICFNKSIRLFQSLFEL